MGFTHMDTKMSLPYTTPPCIAVETGKSLLYRSAKSAYSYHSLLYRTPRRSVTTQKTLILNYAHRKYG
jgi:hypothetical protein